MNTINPSSPFFIAKDEPTYQVGKGVTRQFIGYDKNMMMVKAMFEQGARGESHSHPHAQTTYIISGLFEFTIGDETRLLKAGDGLYAAPDTQHGCVCLEKGQLLDVFAPAREDFLETIPGAISQS